MSLPSVTRRRLALAPPIVLAIGLAMVPGVKLAWARAAAPRTPSKLWSARYNGPGNSVDQTTAVAPSPDGATVFVTGFSTGSGGFFDFATLAYDAATGHRRWLARYNGPGNDQDQAFALGVSPDGTTVFVTGDSAGSGTVHDYATIAYDAATGHRRWSARYNGPANNYDGAHALAVSLDGSAVFVTGSSFGVGTNDDFATVAYDAATGAERWVARYNNSQLNGTDAASALGVSPDGATLFASGNSFGPGTADDFATVAYDAATGTERWVARFDGGNDYDEAATALAVSPDGSTVAVTGDSIGAPTGQDYATVAYDASTGAQRWTARHTGTGNGWDYAHAVAVSPDSGTVFVTGQAGGVYTTLAYDHATGQRRWVAHYDGPGFGADDARGLAVSNDGATLFVTGFSSGSSTVDFATVTYDPATGQQRDVLRFGPGSAFALALSPDSGELFVTGSVGSSTSDFGTVAYRLSP